MEHTSKQYFKRALCTYHIMLNLLNVFHIFVNYATAAQNDVGKKDVGKKDTHGSLKRAVGVSTL
ncbi:hypothetical protein [Desulforamulus ferrireducens]|uniref:Uncharacterized protein n=1 Tax=Desulforamulus ferrireducens TaxID=1833852 RepID=A0A1S6IZI2_9FIRM|nr:hypothetical protein [Desulforamulus ferrireducens]AQS60177.1 hypothetical protein B0537_14470 [Desulforamulus ferrireducens]